MLEEERGRIFLSWSKFLKLLIGLKYRKKKGIFLILFEIAMELFMEKDSFINKLIILFRI